MAKQFDPSRKWQEQQQSRAREARKISSPKKKLEQPMGDDRFMRDTLERILYEKIRGYGDSGPFSDPLYGRPMSRPAPRSEAEELREELASVKKVLVEQDTLLKRLAKGASPIADVVQVNGATTFVSLNGNVVAVETPTPPVAPGEQVKLVGETMQIREKIANPVGFGEVCQVSAVHPDGYCEIKHGGSQRLVAAKPGLEAGDRVVLDKTGQVIVRKLPPLKVAVSKHRAAVSWDSIGGLEDAKRELRDAIELPYLRRDIFAKYGQKPAKGVLLYGPPGTGKSLLGKAVASSLAAQHGDHDGGFIYVKGPEILDKYIGASEENIRSMFDRARIYKQKHGVPAVIFVDEAESILGTRGAGGGSFMDRTIVPQFLAEMDGLDDSGAFVLLATNRPDSLDPAAVRDGRIDRRIKVSRPDRVGSDAIFRIHLKDKPIVGDAEELANAATCHLFSETHTLLYVTLTSGETHRFTLASVTNGAMIAGIVQRATQSAIQREIDGGNADGVTSDDIAVAVSASHAEQRDIDHRGALEDFLEPFKSKAVSVSRERPSIHATAN